MNDSNPVWESAQVMLRRDLVAEGYDDRAIRRMVHGGELRRLRHGVYVASADWEGLPAGQQHQLLARAVLRVAHPKNVLSHVSAAVEYGAPTWGIDLSTVHLTHVEGQLGRCEAGVARHSGVVAPGDVVERNGVLLTSPARAAIEVTTITSTESALVTICGLLATGATTLDELREATKRYKHWPCSGRTRLVVALASPKLTSPGESRTLYMCWSQHLPMPEFQLPIFDESGNVVAYTDFGWPTKGVFLEFDGKEKYHRYRREGETLEAYLLREKRREELICQLTGWICIRITWEDLAHPVRTAARIRRILESRPPQKPAYAQRFVR